MTKMWKEILEQPKVLEGCLDKADAMRPLADRIRSSDIRFVVIAARGTSDHAAIYGKYIIEHELGIPVSLAAPSIITSYGSKMDYRNCVVIAISQSGQAMDVLEVINQARENGALTIGITNDQNSPVALKSEYHLFTDAGEEKSVAATKTFTAQMMTLAILTALWKNEKSLLEALEKIPYNLKNVFALESDINKIIDDFNDMDLCFILARGFNYPIALEAALKIQETCYIEAKGYATSDFYHGPIAMIEKNTPVIIFAPCGPVYTDVMDMYKKVKDLGAKTILVTSDTGILEKNSLSFIIPAAANDMISAFYIAVFSQMFACRLSISKKLDPDKPRTLNKITITR